MAYNKFFNQVNTSGTIGLTESIVNQLKNIKSSILTPSNWSYLQTLNQSISTGSSVLFNSISDGTASLSGGYLLGATNIEDMERSGFCSWDGGAPYWSNVGADFTLEQSGMGYIKSSPVSFAGSQTVTVTANDVNLVYIDSSGVLQVTDTVTSSLFIDNIPLFEVLWDGAAMFVKKENHPCTFDPNISNYLHAAAGVIYTNSSTMDKNTTTLKLIGDDTVNDHGLSTTFTSTDPIEINWFYTNAAGKWIFQSKSSTVPAQWNNAGTPTNLTGVQRSCFRIYGVLDNLNTTAIQWIGVMDITTYNNSNTATTACSEGTPVRATNELNNLEPAMYCYIVRSTTTIETVLIEKASLRSGYVGGTVSSSHLLLSDKDAGQYGLGGHTNAVQRLLSTSTDPTVNNDIDTALEGSIWIRRDNNRAFLNTDNTDGAAVWRYLGSDQSLYTTDSVTFNYMNITPASGTAVLGLNGDTDAKLYMSNTGKHWLLEHSTTNAFILSSWDLSSWAESFVINRAGNFSISAQHPLVIGNTTDSSSKTTGSLINYGGFGCDKKAYFGDTINLSNTTGKIQFTNNDTKKRIVLHDQGDDYRWAGIGKVASELRIQNYAGEKVSFTNAIDGSSENELASIGGLIDANGVLNVKGTADSTSKTSGAALFTGGIGCGGTVCSNNLIVNPASDSGKLDFVSTTNDTYFTSRIRFGNGTSDYFIGRGTGGEIKFLTNVSLSNVETFSISEVGVVSIPLSTGRVAFGNADIKKRLTVNDLGNDYQWYGMGMQSSELRFQVSNGGKFGFTSAIDDSSENELVSIGGAITANGVLTVKGTADSSSKDTGCAIFEGGIGVENNAYIGGNLNVTGGVGGSGCSTSASFSMTWVDDTIAVTIHFSKIGNLVTMAWPGMVFETAAGPTADNVTTATSYPSGYAPVSGDSIRGYALVKEDATIVNNSCIVLSSSTFTFEPETTTAFGAADNLTVYGGSVSYIVS